MSFILLIRSPKIRVKVDYESQSMEGIHLVEDGCAHVRTLVNFLKIGTDSTQQLGFLKTRNVMTNSPGS